MNVFLTAKVLLFDFDDAKERKKERNGLHVCVVLYEMKKGH